MNKKFLSTALALAMLLGSYQAVYATEAKEMPTTEKKIEAVEEKAEGTGEADCGVMCIDRDW